MNKSKYIHKCRGRGSENSRLGSQVVDITYAFNTNKNCKSIPSAMLGI